MKLTHSLIHHFLEESARRYPDKVALIHEDVRATYAEINKRANDLARWLMGRGVAQGDRVVLLMENSLEYVIGYYGVLKSGAVAVPLSTDLKPDGLRPLLAELEPKVVISSSRCERVLQAIDLSLFEVQALLLKSPKLNWSSVSVLTVSWEEFSGNTTSSNPDVQIEESTLANIIYTSGSTGEPKGVMLSHRNIVSNAHSICDYLDMTEKDIQMVVLPFFYVMGKSLLNTHFAVGATVVINNKFAFPATVINQMVDEQVTSFSGVPSTYAYLLYRSPLVKFRDRLGALRYCSQAGGHMSAAIKQELRRVLPEHTKIYVMYGASEASARLTYLEPERYEEKMGSIGKAIPGVTMRVLGPGGCEVAVGQTGELVAYGPNIMMGYWKDKVSTANALQEDGYHTGDLGFKDEEGYFYLQGRRDNLLKVGGHRVNPQEVEDALMATELVIEAAVLGLPDALMGNKLIALACPKDGDCSENAILSHCIQRLPKYQMPSEVMLLRSLPKNASGKIDRERCLQLIISRKGRSE